MDIEKHMNGIKILKDIKNYNENLKDGQKKYYLILIELVNLIL